MKLRDFVFNSLRVRGRKKNTDSTGNPATPGISTGCFGLDKKRNWFPSSGFRNRSDEGNFDGTDFTETKWQGNALYRGLVSARTVQVNSSLMTSDYRSRHGSISAHRVDEFSSQLTRTSSDWPSHMDISNKRGSYSSVSTISEMSTEPHITHQRYCHYHQHNRHFNYHIQGRGMTTLDQNQQELNVDPDDMNHLSSHKSHNSTKPDTGFFRKSFASLRGIRKNSSKSKNICSKQTGVYETTCPLCLHPETNMVSNEKPSDDKRYARTKKKGLKGFLKSKENRDMALSSDNFENPWALDSNTQNVSKPAKAKVDPVVSKFMPYERSHFREYSVESCHSCHFGFPEDSSVRDFDLASFESASLSGYESDFSRCKFHRSRSRIKTNPWLPSPQLSHAMGSHYGDYDLRKSKENIASMEEHNRRTRSTSFENQRDVALSFKTSAPSNTNSSHRRNSSHRSPTRSDAKRILNMKPSVNPPFFVTKWPLSRQSDDLTSKVTALNDLNIDAIKSRPSSIVSPNSEFVTLADNLEQLANNISFEYEDILDTTMDSVSVCKENSQTFIPEIIADEENGNISMQFLKSEDPVHSAHSPDSGIGGLSYSEGETALSTAQKELKVECLPSSKSVDTFGTALKKDQDIHFCFANIDSIEEHERENTCAVSKTSHGDDIQTVNPLTSFYRLSTQMIPSKHKRKGNKSYVLEENYSTTLYESISHDNTSYLHNSDIINTFDEPYGNVLDNEKIYLTEADAAGNTRHVALLIEDPFDIKFQQSYRQLHRPGISMGTEDIIHEGTVHVGSTTKQTRDSISNSCAAIAFRVPRPGVLKTKQKAQVMPRKLNDMEKNSDQVEQGKYLTDAFDFPRNITVSECVESPTENWQWDGQFPMSSSQDVFLLNQQVTSDENEHVSEVIVDSGRQRTETEERVIKLNGTQSRITSHNVNEMTLENICNVNKLDSKSPDIFFEMNDACVQTEFDDDYSNWDELDTLEDLEDNELGLSESTRSWLVMGNMESSSETENSSLAADCQMMMDEDKRFLAEKTDERAAADRLSYEGSTCESNNWDLISRNSMFLDAFLYDVFSEGLDEKVDVLEHSSHAQILRDENLRQPASEDVLLSLEMQPKFTLEHDVAPFSVRAIPENTVNLLFSDIEVQFQEIFKQIYDCDIHFNNEETYFSPQCSDSTFKPFQSESDVEGGISNTKRLRYKSLESAADETKDRLTIRFGSENTDSSMLIDHNYVNSPPSVIVMKSMESHVPAFPDDIIAGLSDKDANGNFLHNRSQSELTSQFPQHFHSPKINTFTDSISTPFRIIQSSEKEFYLPLLRDAQLSRSLMKQSLVLVPGAGPVDNSRYEQIDICAEKATVSPKDQVPYIHSSISSTSLSTYKTITHFEDELQSKREKLHQDYICSTDVMHALTRNLIESTNSTSRHPFQITNYPLDKTDNFPSSESLKTAFSEIMSDHHYSADTTPHQIQHQDSARASSPQLSPPSSPNRSAIASVNRFSVASINGGLQTENSTACLTEKMISLCQEKNLVFQKILEAQQEERIRQEQRLQIQQSMHSQRKEALLQTLLDMRGRLEEHSRRLSQRNSWSESGDIPLKYL